MQLTPEMIADLVINIINILVLFAVVRFLVYKPVKKYLDARTQRVSGAEAAASEKEKQAQLKIEHCDTVIAQSNLARENALKEGEAAGRDEALRLIDDANKKAQAIVDAAQKRADEEYAKRLEQAKDEIADLALNISSKLLERNVTDEDNRRIVDSFLGNGKA